MPRVGDQYCLIIKTFSTSFEKPNGVFRGVLVLDGTVLFTSSISGLFP